MLLLSVSLVHTDVLLSMSESVVLDETSMGKMEVLVTSGAVAAVMSGTRVVVKSGAEVEITSGDSVELERLSCKRVGRAVERYPSSIPPEMVLRPMTHAAMICKFIMIRKGEN